MLILMFGRYIYGLCCVYIYLEYMDLVNEIGKNFILLLYKSKYEIKINIFKCILIRI